MSELEKKLEAALRKNIVELEKLRANQRSQHEPIAIIGMSCRFPGGSNSPEEYWNLLVNGIDGISQVPKTRWDIEAFYDPNPDAEGKMMTRHGGFIDDIELFDADFFGISPREAQAIDPQQRLLLETTWIALESAGIAPESLKNSQTGTFIGACVNDYASLIQTYGYNDFVSYSSLGSAVNALNGRISYTLGLMGPSMAVDTACSSSLVSLHLGCKSLQRGESNLVIAGGANLTLTPAEYIKLSRAKMLSPDGHCKTFDASGDGYARGEGIGVIILKRLSDALQDKDNILAVIRASAVNQDGPSSGLTVPNRIAQVQLIEEALRQAHLQPQDISFVEAHGTGTALGDPIEVRAIQDTYGKDRGADNILLLGSAKSNIGHLEASAGVASVIKIILSMQHQKLPPNLHFNTLNPKINLDAIPAEIISTPTQWNPPTESPRRAGVSSFGFTGTNSHLIIEQAPTAKETESPANRPCHLFTLSAMTKAALEKMIINYQTFLDNTHENIADIVFTVNNGRNHFPYRLAIIVNTIEDLKTKLAQQDFEMVNPDKQHHHVNINIGKDINWQEYLTEIKKDYEQGATIDWRSLDEPFAIKKVVLPSYPFEHKAYSLPAIVPPSERVLTPVHPLLGEMHTKPSGVIDFMGWLDLSALGYLNDHQVYDYIIYPGAGYIEMMLAASLHALDNHTIQLNNIAVEAALRFMPGKSAQILLEMIPSETGYDIAIYSRIGDDVTWQKHATATITNQKIDNKQKSTDIEMLKTVCSTQINRDDFYQQCNASGIHYGDFFQTLQNIYVGEKQALGELNAIDPATNYLAHPALLDGCFQLAIATMPKQDEKLLYLPVGYETFTLYEPLNDHVFTHWIETEHTDETVVGDLNVYNASGKLLARIEGFHSRITTQLALRQMLAHEKNITDWFYQWDWEEYSLANDTAALANGYWLVFRDGPVSDTLVKFIQEKGGTCHVVAREEHPETKEAFVDLLTTMIDQQPELSGVLHVSSTGERASLTAQHITEAQLIGTKSYLHLSQALIALQEKINVPVVLITQEITSNNLAHSPLVALFKTIHSEHPELQTKLIDLASTWQPELCWQALSDNNESLLAISDNKCYVPRFIHAQDTRPDEPIVNNIRSDASYLITGGLGGLGLTVAKWLAENGAGHIILLSRREPDEGIVNSLKPLDSSFSFEALDIGDEQAVADLFSRLAQNERSLKGIFHLAGTVDDATLMNQDWTHFEKVFAAKVYGSYYLHQYSRDLDFFVVFSSSASSLGSPGQANYAAANGFMDALCEYRRAHDLPAKSLSWGPWAEVGMAKTLASRHAKGGLYAINPHDAMQAMNTALQFKQTHITIMNVDWTNFTKQMIEPPSWLQAFTKQKKHQQSLLAQIEDANADERVELVKQFVAQTMQSVLGLPSTQTIDEKRGFFDMGLDSLTAIELKNQLQAGLGKAAILGATAVFDYSSAQKMSSHIADLLNISSIKDKKKKEVVHTPGQDDEPIAIIGMGCRFPGGANNPQAYWELLNADKDAMVNVPEGRWDANKYYDPDPSAPGKMHTKLGGFLTIDVAEFDARYFRLNPKEARFTDPQQRLLLEVCNEALESAFIAPDSLESSLTGVFIGAWSHDYANLFVEANRLELINQYAKGTLSSTIAGRIAYFYGLLGPTAVIDTACSSATVAINDACQNLRSGDCDLALAGGVNLMLSPHLSIETAKAGLLAMDGHCKSFDEAADGYVRGEGCGVIVLKRLSDALNDDDNIVAVVRSSAVNHSGASSGLGVPSSEAQQTLMKKVLAKAKLKPADIDYIEAMATGTAVGDPIEVGAINAVYTERDAQHPFKMGSVKSIIGHLESASGIASVMKVALALHEEKIPAHYNLKTLNPAIDANPAMEINATSQQWEKGERVRRGAVNSFGVSGTNVHIILEEAPTVKQKSQATPERPLHILSLSAKTDVALTELIEKYTDYAQSTDASLSDIAYSTNIGRNLEKYRAVFIADNLQTLQQQLAEQSILRGAAQDDKKYRITFVRVDKGETEINEESATHIVVTIGPETNWPSLLDTLAHYYIQGADIDWAGWDEPFARRKVALPSYPFQRKRYWYEF